MNKKFLSAILFGALMVTATGTFVSCKDYDDDIKDLQGQIDKLATKEDMTSQIATLQAALTAAAKDASDAITKATAAETAAKAAGDDAAAAKAAADKAVADAKAESIKAVQAELETLKKEVEESTEAALKNMSDKVDAATKKVEDIVGKIADMVTSVELVDSYTATDGQYEKAETAAVLKLATATVTKDFTFSKDITGAITFTKGDQKQTSDEFIIRVSPVNAVLTPEMISLVNSKGANLDELMTVKSVEKYDGLLTRAASQSGLWKVTVELKKYQKDAFNAATLADPTKTAATGNYVLFAAQVNNTLSTAETRYATSSFDLTVEKDTYTPQGALNFFVDETNVADINNRVVGKTGKSLTTNDVITYAELEWKNNDAKDEVKDANINKGTADVPVDNRSDKNVHLAVQGKSIKIDLAKAGVTAYKDVKTPSEIRAMYVVLDKANAVQSLNSEINAWNSYTYTGLNQVVEGTSTTIAVNAAFEINDIIGFRVYAVNQDGKLVDPDGRAFYVQIGSEATDWNAVNTVIVPDAKNATTPTEEKSGLETVTFTKLAGAAKFAWSSDKIGDAEAFTVVLVNKDGKTTTAVANDAVVPANFKFEDITKIYTVPSINTWSSYEDDKAYNGTLTVKDATGFALATLKVTMTKNLPTTLPGEFSFKDKQVINGIYNCYLIADTWAAETATKGTMPIENFINFGKGIPAQYIVELAASQKNAKGEVEAQKKNGSEPIDIAKEFIDNTKEHATTVSYNYGPISSKKDADGNFVNVIIKAAEIKTVYNCFYKKEVHTWDWATRAQLGGDYNTLKTAGKPADGYKADPLSTTLTYGNPVGADGTAAETDAYNTMIFGANSIDGTFSKLLSAPYESSLTVKSAKLISDATQKEDYFSVSNDLKFKPIKSDLGSNPKDNVPSTLIINCVDSYGHDVVIPLKMTVAPRK